MMNLATDYGTDPAPISLAVMGITAAVIVIVFIAMWLGNGRGLDESFGDPQTAPHSFADLPPARRNLQAPPPAKAAPTHAPRTDPAPRLRPELVADLEARRNPPWRTIDLPTLTQRQPVEHVPLRARQDTMPLRVVPASPTPPAPAHGRATVRVGHLPAHYGYAGRHRQLAESTATHVERQRVAFSRERPTHRTLLGLAA